MTKKQSIAREAAQPARKAAPRVKTAQHRTIQATSPEIPEISGASHQAIAKIAYSFWEKRGCPWGDPLTDWFRAEEEYRRL